ncbi:MAG: histidinol-phosphate transaminase [Ruminococcaceae bacterium]|nr:histidinol-phosphate transaminase [Oscillospiraceae bacterium]
MSVFFSQKLAALKPYVPGEQPTDKNYIKLNTNESPFPPSEKVKEVINAGAIDDLRLYSDPDLNALCSAIAEYYDVDKAQVFCGNGSDEVLSFAFLAWGCNGVAFPDISYGFYPVFADLYGLQTNIVPLNEDFTLDLKDFNGKAGFIVFANPNAPTGLTVSTNEIEELVASNPDSVVLVDEAYVDFGAETALPLINKYSNILVVRTFSKSRQLAGARLGYAFGCKELIEDLNRIKFSFNPYNVNRLTALAGIEAINDNVWFKECSDKIVNTREALKTALKQRGFYVTDSKTNFVFASHPLLPKDALYKGLKQNGILIRHFNNPKIVNFNRITIGTDTETERLIEAIDRILEEVRK